MTPQDVLARAQKCIGHEVAYVLGKGGFDPASPFPWTTPESGCDCSGFAMWCLGLAREQGGTWYGTDQIVSDATGAGKLFHAVPLADAAPGDLIVYAHQKPGQHGHVGVVALCDGGKPIRVIHCSAGNWKVRGDAVQQSGAGLWTMVPAMVVARLKALEVTA